MSTRGLEEVSVFAALRLDLLLVDGLVFAVPTVDDELLAVDAARPGAGAGACLRGGRAITTDAPLPPPLPLLLFRLLPPFASAPPSRAAGATSSTMSSKIVAARPPFLHCFVGTPVLQVDIMLLQWFFRCVVVGGAKGYREGCVFSEWKAQRGGAAQQRVSVC
jgi:hypothetical protein